LLGNHGQIACGSDLNDALNVATEVEVLAAQYTIALQTGTPILLERDEMDRVIAKFSHYGQPQARADD
jgi:L-fuculose-phosphate aldolase